MLTVDQARESFIASAPCKQGVEWVPLQAALQRIAAVDAISSLSVPPADNSAMDGFAVFSQDLQENSTRLRVSQRIPAGHQPEALQAGTAARILTGGIMPAGADAVVLQEHCDYQESVNSVHILKPAIAGENVRPIGQDIAVGTPVVAQGKRLNAVDLALLAAIGQTQVAVYQALKVAIFSSGDELVEPGQKLIVGQIYNSNRVMLRALCQQLGYSVIDCGIVEDTLSATKTALLVAAEQADIILSSGGVSVGEEDHVRPAIEALGELKHWKVQMKPGKPVVFGRIVNTPVLGLPGNPVSSYVVFQLLGLPTLRALQGECNGRLVAYKIKSEFDKTSVSREEYIRVRLQFSENGQQSVAVFNNQSSGVLSSLSWADGLVRQRSGQTISQGDWVDFLPLHEGML